jgi:hypothetical protein
MTLVLMNLAMNAAFSDATNQRYRLPIVPHAGSRKLTLHDPSIIRTGRPEKSLPTDRDGFSLNVAVPCQPYQQDRLERL